MNIDPKDYIVPSDATIEEVDLDETVVRRKDGTRLTPAEADRIVEKVTRRGRPSLSGGRKHSPQVAVRVSEPLHQRLKKRAEAEGKTTSQVAREAIDHYV